MAEFLIPSGSKRISTLNQIPGIPLASSSAIPIVLGTGSPITNGSTFQISHTDFLDSTVFNKSNTFTELNTFTIEQRIINNGSVTDLTGDGIIIREDIVSGPPTYGFRISSSAEEILFQDIIPPSNGNIFDTFLKVESNVGDISILRNTSIDGNLIVSGGITAQLINVNLVSSSIVYSSGSNIFGNTISNTHQFTGSLRVSGSANVIGGFTQTSGVVSFGGAATFNNSITTFNQGINVLNQSSSFFAGVNIGTSPQTRNLTHFGNYIHTGDVIQTGSISVNGNVIASSFTGSLNYTNLNNIPNGIVSSSTQINQYNIFATTGSNGFVGNQRINGDVVVTGSLIVSGSNTFRNIGRAEFTGSVNVNGGINVTQSITASILSGSFVGDGSSLSGVTAADVDFINVLNKPTLVSGSSQIDLTGTTNYVSGIKTRLNAETVVSSSQQIKTLLPTGTVSGSSQVSFNGIVDKPTLFSSSIQVNADTITNFDANVLAYNNSLGVVSGSSQISFTTISNKPTLVSGSAQITYSGISSIPTGIVSSSTQVLNYGIFATTGSNNFVGNQTITGSLLVSGSSTFTNIGLVQFTGSFNSTGSSNLTGSIVINQLTYPTPNFADGQYGVEVPTLGVDNVFELDIPKTIYEYVKNDSGTTLLKGTPVHSVGASGFNTLVIAASASNAATMPATYILAQDLDDEEEGLGIAIGAIQGIDTTGLTAGDSVYVGANGGFTQTKPTGSNLIQNLGIVTRVGVNGGGVVLGAGRSNDVPNIEEGYFWVGNSGSVATPTPTASLLVGYAITGSNTFVGNQTIAGSLNVTGSLIIDNDVKIENGFSILTSVSQSLEFEDDAAAEIGNVPLGGLYRSGSFIKIRIS
jgi:hypothetical protein